MSRLGMAVGAVSVAGAIWLLPLGREPLRPSFAEPRKEAHWKVDDSRATAVRELAMHQARVWTPPDPSTADLAANPADPNGSLSGDVVRCLYLDGPAQGSTPKFNCVLPDGEIVKVKFGSTTEIQGELVATRFLASLGFGADRMYLVHRLRCFGCLRNPFYPGRILEWVHLWDAAQRLAPDDRYSDFEWAAVERHFEGHEIAAPNRRGWGWEELDNIDESSGANRAERDALRLASLLIGHWDTKPPNQRLVCVAERSATDTCPRPFALVQDLGRTFGLSDGGVTEWKKLGIWKDRQRCTVTMREFTGDHATFHDKFISEEGRQLLARQLGMLHDSQIEALFDSTRVTRLSGPGNGDAKVWAQTMREKIHEIVDGPGCPATNRSS